MKTPKANSRNEEERARGVSVDGGIVGKDNILSRGLTRKT
jgi:hypothetical protein